MSPSSRSLVPSSIAPRLSVSAGSVVDELVVVDEAHPSKSHSKKKQIGLRTCKVLTLLEGGFRKN